MAYKTVFATELFHGMTEAENSFILMVGEPNGSLSVPLMIKVHEAQALLDQQEPNAKTPPNTYRLLHDSLYQFGLAIKELHIDSLCEGMFHASVIVTDGFNEQTIACNAGDAAVLSILEGCPLLMESKVLDEAGCRNDSLINNLPQHKRSQEPTLEDLYEQLRECEENEDYEQAAIIQSMIDSKKR